MSWGRFFGFKNSPLADKVLKQYIMEMERCATAISLEYLQGCRAKPHVCVSVCVCVCACV